MVAEAVVAAKNPRRGVVCLFCGAHTALPAVSERSNSKEYPAPPTSVALVRCHLCLREAAYRAEEIVTFRHAA